MLLIGSSFQLPAATLSTNPTRLDPLQPIGLLLLLLLFASSSTNITITSTPSHCCLAPATLHSPSNTSHRNHSATTCSLTTRLKSSSSSSLIVTSVSVLTSAPSSPLPLSPSFSSVMTKFKDQHPFGQHIHSIDISLARPFSSMPSSALLSFNLSPSCFSWYLSRPLGRIWRNTRLSSLTAQPNRSALTALLFLCAVVLLCVRQAQGLRVPVSARSTPTASP